MLSGRRVPGSRSDAVSGKTGMTGDGSSGMEDLLRIRLEDGEERLLGDLHGADHLHPLLALFLLLEELALARDVAAVPLGRHVLAVGADGRPRDDVAADRSLNGDLELLPVDGFGEPLAVVQGARPRLVAVHELRQGIDLVAV